MVIGLSPFETVKKYLVSFGNYYSYCDSFSPERTFGQMFSCLWSREDVLNKLRLPPLNEDMNRKGKPESDRFRSHGNRLYSERKFDKALLAYNYAILSAPYRKGDSENVAPNAHFDSLSLAYANRSALLYEMGRYEDAVKDIDKAIQHGYPAEKLPKLEERKARCLQGLNTSRNSNKRLGKDKTNSPQKMSVPPNNESGLGEESLPQKFQHLFERGPEGEADFLARVNSRAKRGGNMLSSSVKMQTSEAKGRHLVAAADIEPGEVLMIERAFTSTLNLNSQIRSYCCVCLRKCPVALPCSTCSLVVFCSDNCLNSKYNHHELECDLLPILMTLQLDEEVGLVFKTMLRFSMEEVNNEFNGDVQKNSNAKPSKSILEFVTNYSTLHNLEGNLDKRSGECFLETVVNAMMVVQLLQRVPHFWYKKNKEAYQQTESLLTILGSQIMGLILKFQCNIHIIKELQINPGGDIISDGYYHSGFGLYSAFSLMNHSCTPNVLHSNWGSIKFMYSINFIKQGDDILDSYGERYVSHNKKERQKNLMDVYYFTCECEACSEDWPVFCQLPKKYELKCYNCNTSLSTWDSTCDNCKQVSGEPKIKKNKLSGKHDIKKNIENAWKSYETCYNELAEKQTNFGNIKKIGKYISLMSKHTVEPHMAMVAAQEALLRSFDLMGSFSFQSGKMNN